MQHGRWLDDYTLADFRRLMRRANVKAIAWRHRATNRWNPETQTWEQRQ
jgi:hypothetical protein